VKSCNSFSRNKFQALTPAAQLHSIDKLLTGWEENLFDNLQSETLRRHILECIDWMEQPVPDSISKLAIEFELHNDPHLLSECIGKFRAGQGLIYKDSQLTILKGDGIRSSDSAQLPRARQVIVILDNLRSVFNIGSIFRTAECLGLQAIWLCGICATPDNPALHKTAMGTSDRIAWRHFAETREAIETAKVEEYCVYALETAQESKSVFACGFDIPMALVVGNESLGIAPAVLELCDQYVALPVLGWKNSLNVGVAFAVAAYQIIFGATTQTTDTGE
jgi:tRNA G18 (ribose-2'-O)-methylase SpoU